MTGTEHVDFESTYLDGADYDTETGELNVTFSRNGDSYTYAHVPASVWQSLKSATSPGSFLRREISGKY